LSKGGSFSLDYVIINFIPHRLVQNFTMFSVQLTSKNLELTSEVKSLVFEKLQKLEKLLVNFPPDAITATVLLKKRVHQSKDNVFTTTLALTIPSAIFHSHQEGYTLEESSVGAIEDLKEQLEKHKVKLQSQNQNIYSP